MLYVACAFVLHNALRKPQGMQRTVRGAWETSLVGASTAKLTLTFGGHDLVCYGAWWGCAPVRPILFWRLGYHTWTRGATSSQCH